MQSVNVKSDITLKTRTNAHAYQTKNAGKAMGRESSVSVEVQPKGDV